MGCVCLKLKSSVDIRRKKKNLTQNETKKIFSNLITVRTWKEIIDYLNFKEIKNLGKVNR